jgi:hypothetical protein
MRARVIIPPDYPSRRINAHQRKHRSQLDGAGCSIPLRQDRPAAARQADRATAGNTATQIRRKTPRPPEA